MKTTSDKQIILVVDDTLANIEVAHNTLKDAYIIKVATSGARALDLAKARPQPDVILLDVMMPEVDGLELCRRIRAAERTPYPYVILLTALKGKEHFLEAMGAGVDDFISKPYDPDELRAKLHVAERIVSLQKRVKSLEGLHPAT